MDLLISSHIYSKFLIILAQVFSLFLYNSTSTIGLELHLHILHPFLNFPQLPKLRTHSATGHL